MKLFEASAARSLSSDPWTDPKTGRPAQIIQIDDAGVRVDEKGTQSVVAFDQIGSAASFLQLLARAAPGTPEGKLAFARAALFAALAFDVAPLREYQLSLKVESRPAAASPPLYNGDAFQVAADAAKAAQAAGASADALGTLMLRIEAERATGRAWADGLAAFAKGQYSQAEKSLGEILTNGLKTAAFALATGGAAAEAPASSPAR